MTTMINGFLNISGLESGKIILHISFDIHELITATIKETRKLVSSHLIRFLPGALTLHADCDKIANVIPIS